MFSVAGAGWREKAALSVLSELNTWWLSNYRAVTQARGRIPIEADGSRLLSELKDRRAWMYYIFLSSEKYSSMKAWQAKVENMIKHNESLPL